MYAKSLSLRIKANLIVSQFSFISFAETESEIKMCLTGLYKEIDVHSFGLFSNFYFNVILSLR